MAPDHTNRQGAPATILVPEEELAAEQWRQDRPTPPVEPPTPANTARLPEVEVLQQALDREQKRAHQAEQRADVAMALADRR
jgi:hypothetical protein